MSLFNNSHSSDLIIKLDSKASSRASVSAESLLLTTLFNLFNFHSIGASLPLPHRKITKPPCEHPLFRFARGNTKAHNSHIF